MLGNVLANILDMNREKERGDSVASLAGQKQQLSVEGLRGQAAFRSGVRFYKLPISHYILTSGHQDIQSAIPFIGRVLLVAT